MASRYVDSVIAMRVEVQLMNSNIWKKLVDDSNASSVEAFRQLLTQGSSKLDAILFRSCCPYLFGIWAHPHFVTPKSEIQPQPASLILTKLDETVLGRILSFLSEPTLATSVSSVCRYFRVSIVCKVHTEALFGKSMATDMNQVMSASNSMSSSAGELSDRLKELSCTLDAAYAQLYHRNDLPVDVPNNATPLDACLLRLFSTIPDAPSRLNKLAFGLLCRGSLVQEEHSIDKLLWACDVLLDVTSPANRALNQLFTSSLTLGVAFGAIQVKSDEPMGFKFESLDLLPTIKSRFYRQFTLAEAVMLHMQLQNLESNDITQLRDALFVLSCERRRTISQQLDMARSVCNKIRLMGDDTNDQDCFAFHARLGHLFNVFRGTCAELMHKTELLAARVHQVQAYLFVGQSGLVPLMQSELVPFYDFVYLVWTRSNANETPKDLMDFAMTVTALEQSAVAKNASQKAMTRPPKQSDEEKNAVFLSARNLVQGVLGVDTKVEQAKQREERMSQVLQAVLSDEEQAERKQQLQALLTFRDPLPAAAVDDAELRQRPVHPFLRPRGARVEEEEVQATVATKKSPVVPARPVTVEKVEDKSLRLWNWTPFIVTSENSLWNSIKPSSLSKEEETKFKLLFSRGPEVHYTVGNAHVKLKHFTGEDFSNMKSSTKLTNMVDLARTKEAVQALPQVRARTLVAGAISPSKSTAATASKPEDAPPRIILPLARVRELKAEGKLSTIRLDPHALETYISNEDFELCFKMKQMEFYQLPGWKRDKLKKDMGMF